MSCQVFFTIVNTILVLKNYGDSLVILLDDPGLTLHAREQADLLMYIKEKLCPYFQVVYATHSPFMIDPGDLISVRTVEAVVTKEDKILRTKIGEKGPREIHKRSKIPHLGNFWIK